jgi:hypothetical protein
LPLLSEYQVDQQKLPTLLGGFGGEVVCFIEALLWICGVGVDRFCGLTGSLEEGKVRIADHAGVRCKLELTMAVTMHQRALEGLKRYVLVRWKKRWPIVPLVPFSVAGWAMTADPYKVHRLFHRTVIGAVIFIVVVILFPFRWGGEDWGGPKI